MGRPNPNIWVWVNRRLCIFGDHPLKSAYLSELLYSLNLIKQCWQSNSPYFNGFSWLWCVPIQSWLYEWALQNATSQIIQSWWASRSHCPSTALYMQGMPRVLPKAANKNHWISFLLRSILCDSSKWRDTCKSQWNVEHIWQLWVAKNGHPFLYSQFFLALSFTNETRSASPERLLVAATVVVDVWI